MGTVSTACVSPDRSASRYPARFPLSTVEMYAGASGASVRVSYQLKKCPRYLCMRSIVSNVRSR
jgi:hypothetical protein